MAKTSTVINSGNLKDPITIEESYVSGTGRANEDVLSWRTYVQVFAEAYSDFYSRRNNENIEQNQTYAETLIRFRCRYHDVIGVSETMRVVFEDTTYDIKSVQPDHRNRAFLIIEASRKP